MDIPEVLVRMRTAFLLMAPVFVMGCRASHAPTDSSDASAPHVTGGSMNLRAPDPKAEPALPPLTGEWMEELTLPGGGVVHIAPPVGSTEPRPVVIAIHGAVDDPGLACSAWRLVTDVYPFVVCPGGTKIGRGKHVWPSSDAIDKAAEDALAAVRAKYGDRVRTTPAIYTGFSQGANMAGPVLAKKKGRFARAVLTEGGYGAFESPAQAKAFVNAGGERVLFTCSQAGCAGSFERSRIPLTRAGAEVQIQYAGNFGHSMPPQVREAIHGSLPWLVAGLDGWESYASAPKLPSH